MKTTNRPERDTGKAAAIPETYLTRTANGWQLHHAGQPLTHDRATFADCHAVAARFKVAVAAEVWSAARGCFVTLAEAKRENDPRAVFAALLDKLTPEARRCDFGLFVTTCAGPMVNNFTEGRDATLAERFQWLFEKLTARRLGRFESVTLAGLFPEDAATVRAEFEKTGRKGGAK